ncbi:unnamed protein product [Urochloa decumbens]|uniref:RING-type E3 ubiquitin transferase n=1 Tax=Urochloa decumbens TaxID=240449 RepID=A0ABC9C0U3_9POAL
MGAERARRWKLFPSFRSLSLPPASPSKRNKHRPPPEPDVPLPPPTPAEEEPEEVPAEFLCPILRAPMADPVILPSGRTYERACVRACTEFGLSLAAEGNAPGGGGGGGVPAAAIPNDALRAAVRTWCARSGLAPPVPPSAETAREAVLRAVPAPPPPPPERAASNLSCSSEAALAPARSASNLSCSSEGACAASTSSSSSSSGRSSREMAAGEVSPARGRPAASKDNEEEEPSRVADADAEAEAEAVVRAVEAAGKDESAAAEVVEAALSALRRATRESPARRRALCASPRLLASLRRVLLSSRRHTPSARADAAASLANLTLEPENRVPLVRAGAVPALVAASSASAAAKAREHAAGALFGLALHEGNRAAIGVLGAVPPLLAVLSGGEHADDALPTRARRDAGMALYHLSLAAVNQCKLARAPGAARTLLAVASDGGEAAHIRRLALMVACNVAGCVEGRAALMDAGAVAAASAILSDNASRGSELQEWCVAALYAMSRGSPRFRGLARAAGADRPLMLFAEQASPGVHKEMAEAALRTVLGLAENGDDDDQITECRSSDGNRGASNRVAHRRRVASWSAPPPATPASTHQWRPVCID